MVENAQMKHRELATESEKFLVNVRSIVVQRSLTEGALAQEQIDGCYQVDRDFVEKTATMTGMADAWTAEVESRSRLRRRRLLMS